MLWNKLLKDDRIRRYGLGRTKIRSLVTFWGKLLKFSSVDCWNVVTSSVAINTATGGTVPPGEVAAAPTDAPVQTLTLPQHHPHALHGTEHHNEAQYYKSGSDPSYHYDQQHMSHEHHIAQQQAHVNPAIGGQFMYTQPPTNPQTQHHPCAYPNPHPHHVHQGPSMPHYMTTCYPFVQEPYYSYVQQPTYRQVSFHMPVT